MEPSVKQVLAYWRWFAACELLNDFNVSSHQIMVANFDLVTGKCMDQELQKQAPCEFWLCVFQIQHSGKIIPCVWLPVCLDPSGNLAPSNAFALPYCPSYLFDSFAPLGGLFGKIEFFHNVLKDLFFENGSLNTQLTWQSYYQKTCDLIQYLHANQPNVQRMHVLSDQHACFFSKNLTWLNEENYENSSPLAKSILEIDESPSFPFMDVPQLVQDAHLLCGTIEQKSLTSTQMDIAAHALHFQNIQAVRTPVGSHFEDLLQVLIASIFIQKNLKNQEFSVAILSDSLSENNFEALYIDRKPSSAFIDETATLLDRPVASEMEAFKLLKNYLEECVKSYKKNILAASFAFTGDTQKLNTMRGQRETLQKIDEEHENLLDKLNEITQKWKEYSKPSFFQNIKFFFLRVAKKERIST
ncbi:MAG TPA: hypothetical protein VFP93_04635, partial [Gammaproteobacteria bacterium]|nr:hypothetical protein [Gammaproteobacteria bacterium]